ncbi:hypothetical protein Micbo1qcDRAFT_207633 [Microdochium bolleyi]|uniref:Uncharacterized protein n=1 Tax=Microdochium bolleyi TaxID=196109 RepID=A0A136ISF2_9PEZI|nr:hypothetical protein Micbo1qcDRAFT_207633 [Microdochium bolleyi]
MPEASLVTIFGGILLDKVMIQEAVEKGRYDYATGKLVVLPKDRMQENVWIAAVLTPFSLLLFGWIAQFGIHVAAALGTTFGFDASSMLIFGAANTTILNLCIAESLVSPTHLLMQLGSE